MSDLLERPRAPQREGLCRSVPFELVRADGEERGDGLTIEGYGVVFNSRVTIDSWEGTFDEVVASGAAKKSLRERTPKMQFDHGHHPLLGSLPLGRWTTAEEEADRGVHGIGRLSNNWLVEPFRDAIRDEGVTGMSMRFSVVREEWTDAQGKKIRAEDLPELLYYGAGDRGPILRTLKEIRISEMGPVTWPAYEETSVGVRSRSGTIVIDLAQLNSPRVRSELARAVALADAAAPKTSDALAASVAPDARTEPQPTAAPAADEHPQGPQVTADVAAGEHSSVAIDPRRSRMREQAARVKAAMNKIR